MMPGTVTKIRTRRTERSADVRYRIGKARHDAPAQKSKLVSLRLIGVRRIALVHDGHEIEIRDVRLRANPRFQRKILAGTEVHRGRMGNNHAIVHAIEAEAGPDRPVRES